MPHFLFGDEQLRTQVKGMHPDFEKHRTIIYFEPLTGFPIKGNKRVQLNTKLVRDERIKLEFRFHTDFFK